MKLKNPFSQSTRSLWFPEHTWCAECGRAHTHCPLELHHIHGRCSNSPYNSIPLCKECHDKIAINKGEKQQKYVTYAEMWLNEQGYERTTNDAAFLNNIGRRTATESTMAEDPQE